MPAPFRYTDALAAIWERSGYDRGFISNPFAGDEAARLGLRRTEAILARFGNPHHRYAIVHVAGSKGKGSTTTMIDAILRAAGERTGRYISPHLHSYRERIAVDDAPISKEDFARLTRQALEATRLIEREQPELGEVTAWELTTAMALIWYAEAGCTWAVIEVGLGGTLDATNVVSPAVSVITRLDYEHTAVLGDTIEEIAANKAGIIKPGAPVVSAHQVPAAMEVIAQRAELMGSRLLIQDRDFATTGTDTAFSYRDDRRELGGLSASLIGRHQVENAGLAIAAAQLAIDPPETAIRTGLAHVVNPGRFEIVTVPGGPTVVIDGAHTPIAAAALRLAIEERFPGQQAHLVVGMLQGKDADKVLANLAPIAASWHLAPLDTPRTMAVQDLAPAVPHADRPIHRHASVATALTAAMTASPHALIVVTGSLSTAAEARVALGLATNDPAPNAEPRVSLGESDRS
ncbi:MAG: folylpolyglutamate synthase/dihydrofolate synthase family protein [Thermomicrobiales bacterium]